MVTNSPFFNSLWDRPVNGGPIQLGTMIEKPYHSTERNSALLVEEFH